MAILVLGSSMSLLEGIEVRSGRSASIGAIAILMNMEAVFARRQTSDLALNFDSAFLLKNESELKYFNSLT
jgi:hypothetical protein